MKCVRSFCFSEKIFNFPVEATVHCTAGIVPLERGENEEEERNEKNSVGRPVKLAKTRKEFDEVFLQN